MQECNRVSLDPAVSRLYAHGPDGTIHHNENRRKEKATVCSLVTLVITLVVFWAARALNLFPVASRSKLRICCFCSLGLAVLLNESSNASKSSCLTCGRERRTYKWSTSNLVPAHNWPGQRIMSKICILLVK